MYSQHISDERTGQEQTWLSENRWFYAVFKWHIKLQLTSVAYHMDGIKTVAQVVIMHSVRHIKRGISER